MCHQCHPTLIRRDFMWIKTTDDRLVNTDSLSEICFRNKTRGIDFSGDTVTICAENIVPQIADAIIRGQNYMEVR